MKHLKLALAVLLANLTAGSALAQDWGKEVPKELKGNWAEAGGCNDPDARKLSFFSGGFRWKRDRENQGFVRGEYLFYAASGLRSQFRLIDGDEASDRPKYNLSITGKNLERRQTSNGMVEYFVRCD